MIDVTALKSRVIPRIGSLLLVAIGVQCAIADDSLKPSAGVTIRRLTDDSAIFQLSYYDISTYSALTDRVYVNRRRKGRTAGGIWDVLAIDLATGKQEVIASRRPPTSSAARFDLSPDGRLISYLRMNDAPEGGFDLYAYDLNRPGEFRITRSNFTAKSEYVKTSPATWDSAAKAFILAFAVDRDLYVVRTGAAIRANSRLKPVVVADPDDAFPFHRLRLNPVYPHLLFYRREAKVNPRAVVGRMAPRMYVTDLRSSAPRGVKLFRDGGDVDPSHPGWTPDGRKIAVAGIWAEFPVVNEKGNIPESLELGYADGRQIGPFGRDNAKFARAMWGAYSPDGRKIAVATVPTKKAPGELYLMDRQRGTVRRLVQTKLRGGSMAGEPIVSFVGNSRKILLSTDNYEGQERPSHSKVYLVDPGRPDQ